jgi:hypothetical protein
LKGQRGYWKRFTCASLIGIFFLIIFLGCAKKDAIRKISDEEILRERVTAYWNHKVKQEFDKSYEYEDPLYRKKNNMVNYIRSFNTARAGWYGAGIEGLKIEGDSAIVDMKVRVKIIVSPSGSIEQDTPLKEKWVKVAGIWYHVPQKFKERQSSN